MKSYSDLAEAVEDLKSKGFHNLSGDLDEAAEELQKKIEKMSIIHTYHFEGGTDPADESTLYVLELEDKTKCFMVLGFGTYKDPEKSKIIDALKKLEHE